MPIPVRRHATAQARLFAGAAVAGRVASRAVGSLWQELLAVLRTTGGYHADYWRALHVLRRVGPVTGEVLTNRAVRLYAQGFRGAAAGLPRRLREGADGARPAFVRHEKSGKGEVMVLVDPDLLDAAWRKGHPDYYLPPGAGGKSEVKGRREAFHAFLATGKPIQAPRVDLDPETGAVDFTDGRHRFAVLRDLDVKAVGVMVPRSQADAFRDLFGVPPEPVDAAARGAMADLILPAFDLDQILSWLAPLVRPADYALLGTDSDRRVPEQLAHEIALGMSQGKTQREIATAIRPHLDGSRVRAARAARTFGLLAAHQGQRDAWKGLGDDLLGYRLQKTTVPDSRWWHRERVGTEYFFDPPPGRKGMSSCPHPPLEPKDASERPPGTPSIAWNCLCFLEPILSD